MKRIFYACSAVACAATLASCQKDGIDETSAAAEGTKNVNITLGTDKSLFTSTRAGGEVNLNGFKLIAFRMADDNSGYTFFRDIPMDNFTYNDQDMELNGTVNLDYGTYKFLPSFGLAGNGNINWPDLSSGTALTDNLNLTYPANGPVPEIFMDIEESVTDLPTLTVDLNNAAANNFSTTLFRSVGRVDIQFIAADELNGNIVPSTRDVTGGYATGSLTLKLDGLSPQMNLTGQVPQTDDQNLVEYTYHFTNLANTGIRGINPTDNVIGTDAYSQTYDNIQGTDLIQGSIYFPGSYYFPQYEPNGTTDDSAFRKSTAVIEIVNDSSEMSRRTITIPNLIPVRQNMVSVIKVYVLSDHIYSTKANFVIGVDVAWAGSISIEGSID